MFEVLQLEFMRNAFLSGFLTSIICGIIGTLVVVNRVVFLSGGIAHAAYGGIGLAFFFGFSYRWGILGFALIMSMIMATISLKVKQRSDTLIGVLWAVGMALGVILLDLTPGYNVDLMSYLFGSILTVSKSDLLLMLVIDIVILLVIGYYYNDLLSMSYDEEFAQVRGVPVRFLYFLMIAMIALSVVIIIQIVGLILVIALLTIPPYIAERRSSSLLKMMLYSIILNIFFILTGLCFSYYFNLTSGPTIIMVASICFFLSLIIERLKPDRNP